MLKGLTSFLFCFLSQDGKSAEDLAAADQHEHIVVLLGKLKKVKLKTHIVIQIKDRELT